MTKSKAEANFRGKAKCIPANPRAIFLPFQSAWINDRSRIKGAEKSRQIGWTWGDAADTTRQLSLAPSEARAGAKLDTWITSRDDFQAQLYLQDCRSFADVYQLGADAIGGISESVIEFEVDGKKQKTTAYKLPFASGGNAYSLSSNEDAQAGKRGTRKLDEFALHPRPRRLYGIAQPGITWGGQLAFFSTHRGSHNFFNTLIKEIREGGNPKMINLHRVTLEDALNQGLLYKLQSKWPLEDPMMDYDETAYFNHIKNEAADEETFNEEYMCVPSDDASAFIPYELIDQCKYAPGVKWELSADDLTREIYMGVDVGRHSDLTVIYVIEKRDGLLFTRRIVRLKKTDFETQHNIISTMMRELSVVRCCIDRSGLGEAPAERLQRAFRGKVEGIVFVPANKEMLAIPVKMRMEDRSLLIPDDPKLTAAIRKIRKEASSSDTWRFVADSNSDGHADEFWALALAIHAGSSRGERVMPQPMSLRGGDRTAARSNRRLQGA